MKLLKRRTLLAVSAALGLAFVVAVSYGLFAQAPKTKDKPKGVPVKVALSERKDTPVYLNSIATVQAFNTVVVRTRVDGQIERILFSEGGNVRRGQVLAELDKKPFEVQLRAAIAQKAKDDAQLAKLKQELARYEILVQQDSIAVQTRDTERADYEQLRAVVAADQAQIDSARLQLGYAEIRAPMDGRMGARLVDAGNMVHPGDANGIAILSQLHPISVSFSLPQAMLPALREQQARRVRRVQALSADGTVLIDEGNLTLIESQIDLATGTIRCKATFENAREALWPGAFVTVKVLMDDLPDTVTIPTSAIQLGAQRPFVYVVDANNKAQLREVEPGPASGSRTVIFAGLNGGERVVTEGQFQLEAGKLVDISFAARPPAGSSQKAQH